MDRIIGLPTQVQTCTNGQCYITFIKCERANKTLFFTKIILIMLHIILMKHKKINDILKSKTHSYEWTRIISVDYVPFLWNFDIWYILWNFGILGQYLPMFRCKVANLFVNNKQPCVCLVTLDLDHDLGNRNDNEF